MSRTMATYTYETIWSLQSLTTGAVVAMSGFDAVTELDYLQSQSAYRLNSWRRVPACDP
jgi:hypothetical protein